MCEGCSLGGSEPYCPRCQPLVTRVPFDRTTVTPGGVWNHVWECFKREWGMLLVSLLVFVVCAAVVTGILDAIMELPFRALNISNVVVLAIPMLLSNLVTTAATAIFDVGFQRVLIDVLEGRKADLRRMFSQFPKAGTIVVQKVLLFALFTVPLAAYFGLLTLIAARVNGVPLDASSGDVFTFVWSMLLQGKGVAIFFVGTLIALVPIIYFFLPLIFANTELAYADGVGAMESIKNIFVVSKHRRGDLIVTWLLTILIAFVGMLALCVGIIPAAVLIQMMYVGLYLGLRNGSGLRPPH